MESKVFNIWPQDESVSLRCYEGAPGAPSVLILPGGGYQVCARPEAEPVGERFARMGYNAYVLRYSVVSGGGKVRFPDILRQVEKAVEHIRREREGTAIAMIGFSAGGHLAACYCGISSGRLRPDVCVLGYAALAEPGKGMLERLWGSAEPGKSELESCSPMALCGGGFPPAFLFHSVTDPLVPVSGSVEFAAALERAGAVYELHLFGSGGHAYGLGEGTDAGAWVALADSFIKSVAASPESFDRKAVWCASSLRRPEF